VSEQRSLWQRYRWLLLVLGALVLVGLCVAWLLKLMASGEEPRKKKVIQEIALMKPPPPPPPPKTPPPPPKDEIREKMDIPKQDAPPTKSEAPPPGPDLAVDAAGTGAGDGFGLVGKKGGADLVGSGGGSGTGNKFAWYGALVKERIQDAIARDKKLREAGEFKRDVNVWVSASGQVTRVELMGPGEKAELDEAIRAVLKNLPALREGAPGDMPQPIRLRIASR
jgi:protein TonB